MRFDPLLPFATWTALGERIGVHANAASWWLGDWLLFGRMKYGRRYKEAIAITGLDYQTLRNYAAVARRYQPARRRADVSFQHHAEVAALADELQDRWLHEAAVGGWSKSELRRRLRAARGAVPEVSGTASVLVSVDRGRERRWRAAARRSDRSLERWIGDALDAASTTDPRSAAAPAARHPEERPMRITEAQLEAELVAFGLHRTQVVTELAHEGIADGIGPSLLLALGSRETELCNIAGDEGHGRGVLQIDDRFHAPWLEAHAGCDVGTWEARHRSALPPGRVPTLTASTLKAIELLRSNVAFGRAQGVPKRDLIRFACAAYNAGAGGALAGVRAGDVDARTAHGDYSADVLERKAVVTRWLKRNKLPV
jgi:hypothetical protein